MKYNIKFAPEKRKDKSGSIVAINVPLFADIRFAGKRIFYFTGYRFNVDWDDDSKSAWNFGKEEIRKGYMISEGKIQVKYSEVNTRLNLIRGALAELFKGNPEKNEVISRLNEVCGKVNKDDSCELEFYQLFEYYAREQKLSEGRRKHILSTIAHWKNFDKNITFKSVNSDTLKSFEKFLLSQRIPLKPGSREYKTARGANTVNSILKVTRAYWNFAKDRFKEAGLPLHYPFENYSIPTEVYTRPIYITKEERDLLFEAILSSERLSRVRDIFVFQCLTGARVGDLCKLTRSNISNDILSYIPHKTKEEKPVVVTIPLSNKAKVLLARYNLPDGRLMPFITDQRYNEYIKELFREVGLTRIVTRLNPTNRKEEQVRICDIASSHMARRAFIGNLYGKVDTGIISSMSGHTKGSKAFARYYDVSLELQQNAINQLD